MSVDSEKLAAVLRAVAAEQRRMEALCLKTLAKKDEQIAALRQELQRLKALHA